MPSDLSDAAPDVTRILDAARRGDARAAGQLLPLVYEHLRGLARQRMAAQSASHTLQATALVHEAYLRLVGDDGARFADRSHFFFAAAQAMRQILVDHARARGALRRGGGRGRVPLNSVLDLAAEERFDEFLSLDEALSRLQQVSPEVAEMVRLRFYAGLSIEEAAGALGVSPATVKRDWTFARAWLLRELGDPSQ
jgi:RNA polymerase sigma factor (TIGR02999 family)